MTRPRPFPGYQAAPLTGVPGAPATPAGAPDALPRKYHRLPSWERPPSTLLRRALIFALLAHLAGGAVLTVRFPRSHKVSGAPGNFHIDIAPQVTAQRAAHVAPPVQQPPAEPAPPKAEPVIEKPKATGQIVPRAVLPPTRRPSQGALIAPGAPTARNAITAPTSFEIGTGGEGGPNEFAYYLNGVRAKIERAWTPPRGSAGKRALTAKVAFTIGRNGQVSTVTLDERSGVSFFDQTCMDAVRRANPFAPLPSGYGYDDMVIRFAFTYAD